MVRCVLFHFHDQETQEKLPLDPVTHGLIGSAAGGLTSYKTELRLCALAGAIGAMLPDLDVLIALFTDPITGLIYHRHFTHSLFVAPVLALIPAGVIRLFLRESTRREFLLLYGAALAGMVTASLADVITSYGVYLFWPLADYRISLNLISVFDPLFSLVILIAVIWGVYHRRNSAFVLIFVWILFYLLVGANQQQRAQEVITELAAERGHHIDKLIVKPTIGNIWLWSGRYIYGDSLHADAVHLLPFANPVVYEGKSAEIVDWQNAFDRFQGTKLYRDIERFAELSEGLLVKHPDHRNVLGDGRYAMLPTSVKPLWGISIDTTAPGRHVRFDSYREMIEQDRDRFLEMVMGR